MATTTSEESECLGDWEELDETGVFDEQIARMKAAMATNKENSLRCTDKPVVIFNEEEGRTRYSSSEPTVKILKRPTVSENSALANGDSSRTPKAPAKTLQQRELEYAEARLRILGEARSPEEELVLEEKTVKIQKIPKIDILRPEENDMMILRHPRGPDGWWGKGKKWLVRVRREFVPPWKSFYGLKSAAVSMS